MCWKLQFFDDQSNRACVSNGTEDLNYCPFADNQDRCAGSCNSFDDQSNRVCVSNGTEDLNLNVFNNNRNK